ncbi:hypothetical protein BRD17_01860 [Halobacteriales archaeon SW_7_68_16]|nr:MAG: hypothetical protein BRD17_01860 [Halobacteriales archaeon SW_7_68_16]
MSRSRVGHTVAGVGGYFQSLSVDPDGVELVVQISRDRNVRRLVDELGGDFGVDSVAAVRTRRSPR